MKGLLIPIVLLTAAVSSGATFLACHGLPRPTAAVSSSPRPLANPAPASSRPVEVEPRLDGSTDSAYQTSVELMKASLPNERHAEFDGAMATLEQAWLMQKVEAIAAGQEQPPLRERLDGLSADGVFTLGAFLVPKVAAQATRAIERAAVGTLKSIASAQAQCAAAGAIDTDGDGVGEYGFFSELSGAAPIRAQGGAVGTSGDYVRPALLSAAFGNVVDGGVQRSGYCFRVYLPDGSGLGRSELEAEHVDAAAGAKHWMAYAWPLGEGDVFFVDERGVVLRSSNAETKYGRRRAPDLDAAFVQAGSSMGRALAIDQVGANGQTWAPVD